MKTIIPIALISVLLLGCSNPDVEAVKESRMQSYPDFTVTQAFDNRHVCKNTEWSSREDDRKREIVQYRCYFNGVQEAYTDYANLVIEEATNAESITRIDQLIEAKREALDKANLGLKEAEKRQREQFGYTELQSQYDQGLAKLTEFFNRIKGKEAAHFLQNELDAPDSSSAGGLSDEFWRITANLKNEINGYRKAVSRNRPEMTQLEAEDAVKRRLAQLQKSETYYLEGVASERDRRLKAHLAALVASVKEAQAKVSKIQDSINTLANDKESQRRTAEETIKRAESLRDWSESTEIFEYYEWVSTEGQEPILVAGGITETPPFSEDVDNSIFYNDPDNALFFVYENAESTYADYRNALQGSGWLRLP